MQVNCACKGSVLRACVSCVSYCSCLHHYTHTMLLTRVTLCAVLQLTTSLDPDSALFGIGESTMSTGLILPRNGKVRAHGQTSQWHLCILHSSTAVASSNLCMLLHAFQCSTVRGALRVLADHDHVESRHRGVQL